MDEDFSLHFQLGDVKSGLSEARDKMDDIRMGEVRSRGSRGSGESQLSNDWIVTASNRRRRNVTLLSALQCRLVT